MILNKIIRIKFTDFSAKKMLELLNRTNTKITAQSSLNTGYNFFFILVGKYNRENEKNLPHHTMFETQLNCV